MNPAMYLFINKGLGMSPGKIAAQAGHAAAEAALLSHPDLSPLPEHRYRVCSGYDNRRELWDAWRLGGHYVKYVMEARDGAHLLAIERYLQNRGFKTALIIDEGRTEVDPITPTALGVALVDKDDEHTSLSFSSFSLYREEPKFPAADTLEAARPTAVLTVDGKVSREDFRRIRKQWDRAVGVPQIMVRRRRWWHRF